MPGDKQHPTTSDLVARRLDALIVCAQDDDFSGPEVGDSPLLINSRVSHLDANAFAADWEADAKSAPPVPDEVRLLLERGETRKAAKLYMKETGAGIGETTAALGELTKELRED